MQAGAPQGGAEVHSATVDQVLRTNKQIPGVVLHFVIMTCP